MNLKTLLVFTFLCLGISLSYGQAGRYAPVEMLDTREENVKTLYEKTFDTSIDDDDLKYKMSTTTQNHLDDWKEVLDFYANDPSADLTYIQFIVNAMEAKLN